MRGSATGLDRKKKINQHFKKEIHRTQLLCFLFLRGEGEETGEKEIDCA